MFVSVKSKDMGESACLVRSFSHPSDSSTEAKKEVRVLKIIESFCFFGLFYILLSVQIMGLSYFLEILHGYISITAFLFYFILLWSVCVLGKRWKMREHGELVTG